MSELQKVAVKYLNWGQNQKIGTFWHYYCTIITALNVEMRGKKLISPGLNFVDLTFHIFIKV